MGKTTILVVEDEAAIQQLVSYNLIKAILLFYPLTRLIFSLLALGTILLFMIVKTYIEMLKSQGLQ